MVVINGYQEEMTDSISTPSAGHITAVSKSIVGPYVNTSTSFLQSASSDSKTDQSATLGIKLQGGVRQSFLYS